MKNTRRTFMKTASSAALAPLLVSSGVKTWGAPGKRRYAILGTGHRGVGMWGKDLLARHGDKIELCALVDRNPKRLATAKTMLKAECPTYLDFDRMLAEAKPDLLAVCTIDTYHADHIVTALDRGIDVITEKPMVIDERQCQRVLDAAARHPGRLTVAFNYRYAPMHQKLKEVLLEARTELGRVTSVDFNWYLDVKHGADYFRRWHRLKNQGGSLWVHKATHHFDLVNWWLDADPVSVVARGSLERYGKNGRFRHSNCRPCPHKTQCEFYRDITKDARLMALYAAAEDADGYLRDGCVFREDVDIYDTMAALVTYSNGTVMSYSLNAFVPFEGHRIAFNCERGRVEVRHFDAQPWPATDEVEFHVTPSFGARRAIKAEITEGGHWGGDPVLMDKIFLQAPGPDYLRLPGARAGALSCLTGVAARISCEEQREVRIADLVTSLGSPGRS